VKCTKPPLESIVLGWFVEHLSQTQCSVAKIRAETFILVTPNVGANTSFCPTNSPLVKIVQGSELNCTGLCSVSVFPGKKLSSDGMMNDTEPSFSVGVLWSRMFTGEYFHRHLRKID